MANDREPAKLLLPYLQRADELQKHEPLVAYYCRLYAMERGMKIPAKERTKTTSALLISLMSQLEKDKKSLTLGPEDHLYVEGFALNVFAKADKQDRAGRADLNTAKTFYAASIFFEILGQFGELQPEIEQKQKYAVWKAAEIRKAIKEGRRPEPGPPGGDQDLSGPVNSSWKENSSPEQLRQENSQAGQQNVSSVSMPDGGTKSEPLSQFPGNLQQYSADRITKSEPLSQFPGNHQQYSADRITKSEPFSQFPGNLQQYSADRITKSEPLSQFPQNLQHHSADKMQPPPAFSSGDYQTAASHSQAPQDYLQYSESNQTAYPSSYFTMPATPQDTHGGQVSAGYSYSMMPPSHDSSNASQPYPLNYQSYPTMHDGSLDSQSLSHTSYPSNASYYQNINENHPSVVPYVNPPSNQEFQSNLQYSSVAGTNGGYRESTPLERTSSAPATTPAPAPAPAPAAAYSYNSSYQPPPEKIAEAHKAARFAVGALAFDDVPTAVEHLKRSLEMLTLPSTS